MLPETLDVALENDGYFLGFAFGKLAVQADRGSVARSLPSRFRAIFPGGIERPAVPFRRPRTGRNRRQRQSLSPSTSTGVDGARFLDGFAVFVEHGADLAVNAPARSCRRPCSVPFWTSTVRDVSAALIDLGFEDDSRCRQVRVRLSFCMSATRAIISSSRSRFLPVLAETSTVTVSPPQSSPTGPAPTVRV
jgi:hypothetical protein